MATFHVRCMTHEDTKWMWDTAIQLGWEISYGEPEAFWAMDETGFFVGELDGKIISCVGCLKYNDTLAHVTMYIVDEQHRGKGYGLKTFNAAIQSLPSGCNVGLVTFDDRKFETMYQKSGFKVHWRLHYKTFNIAQLASIECPHPNDFIIQSISSGNMSTVLGEAITEYDRKHFHTARPRFVKQWILSLNDDVTKGTRFIARKGDGEIIGLIVIKQPISNKVFDYQVGPFYADSIEIAICLLKHACSHLTNKGLARQECGIIYPENNANGAVLADKLKATLKYNIIRMFIAAPPAFHSVDCVYSISYVC